MRKKYIGKGDPLILLHGKVYTVLSVERGWYGIVDETGEDYLFPPELFAEPDETKSVDMDVSGYILSRLR